MKPSNLFFSIILGLLFGLWLLLDYELPIRLCIILGIAFGWCFAHIERGLLGGDNVHILYNFDKAKQRKPHRDIRYFTIEETSQVKSWERFATPHFDYRPYRPI